MVPHFDSYLVYALHPKPGQVGYRLTGKYLLHDGTVHVVSDHDGILDGLDGKDMGQVQGRIENLAQSSHFAVVKKKLLQPAQPAAPADDENAWEAEVFGNGGQVQQVQAPAPAGDGVFRYHRAGHDAPRTIAVKGGLITVDGQSLPPEEVQALITNVQNGVATLQRVQAPNFAKSAQEAYSGFLVLQKSDLNQSFEALRHLVAAGHLHPDHYDALRRELYQDEMIPGLGNKKAFRDFMKSGGRGGVHVMFDGNGMKSINDTHGHEAGDQAIQGMGQALRNAIDKTVGPDIAKAHRFGGDEFHLHVPTVEQAHHVLRQFRAEMDAIPPIKGSHKLSMSAGIGGDPGEADKALYHAKAASKLAPGQSSLVAHSLHPAAPGPMPTEPIQAPPKPAAPAPLTAPEPVVKT